ncbi:ubiquinol-cytochrome-c reductase complex assembly factor 1-like isoform X2 [Pecten maximus]|uniref:ubiquinol-cytochrome-c reductase complex assembly factor 1-like isoform X2 n=1 Tax=Pecten maximus TaxID=6579 RepID=UPI001458EB91|nr:ubiquinol-cytochrome-c reductase complex assembly factor 1-like isoform X2 [Pecten maximus]
MLGIRLLAQIPRCACQNAIKIGFKTEEQVPNADTEEFHNISFFRKVKHAFGFDRDLKVPYKHIELAAYRIWLCISDHTDHGQFIEALGLPDTFNTWFLVNELHIWIILTRLNFEGVEGRYFRNVLITMMWKSTETRMKEMETVTFSERKEYSEQMKHHLQNAFLFYDEGLLSDDKALANALWNILFERNDVTASQMELIVHYVRREVFRVDQIDSKALLSKGFVPFGTLYGERKNEEKKKIALNILNVEFVPK